MQGNLAPGHMVTGGPEMEAEIRRIVRAFAAGPHIFNLGHGITPDVDPERLGVLIEAVHGLSAR